MNDFQNFFGNPEATTYEESKKILDFVEITKEDVFYDLGCGYGTVCTAAAETGIPKKIVGVEARVENFLEATNRILEKNLEEKIILRNEFIENVDFSDATIIYYSIKPNLKHLLHIKKMIKKNCKIITPNIPLPSIMPIKITNIQNSKFFLMQGPLDKYKSENANEWIRMIIEYNDAGINKLLENKHNSNWIRDLLDEIYKK